MVQIDYQFASEKVNMEVSDEQVVTAGPMVTMKMATFCGRGAVAATQCSKRAIANLAAFLMGQLAAWGLASGALVVRADQETSLTTLLDEIKARRPETLVERTAVESHQSIGAVERMNREVGGLLRTLKAALEARIGAKMGLDHDLISWMIRHSVWLITSAYELIRQRRYGGAIAEFGEIVWARIPTVKKLGKLDQRWVEVVWAGKAEGSDEHIGLDHRGARRFRAVRREPESSRWRREVILEDAGCLWDMIPVGRTSPPDAFSRVSVCGDHAPALQAAGTAAAEAELPAAEPPQPGDDWTDIANTPITASGRRVYITGAMVKKFGVTMGCPRCQNGTGTHSDACRARMLSSMASQASVAPPVPAVDMAVDRQGPEAGGEKRGHEDRGSSHGGR